jgi:hypothetical protein
MFTTKTLTLAALLIAGGSTIAVAYEDPENKIGDRYPSLEQRYTPVAPSSVATKRMTVSKFDSHASEDPENKIGDRYPMLEQTYAPTSTGNARMAAPQVTKLDQYANEVPENKIGDRYPFLEQPIQTASVGSHAVARSMRTAHSIKVSNATSRERQTARNSY